MPLTAKPTESVFVRKSGYSLSNCITPFLYIGTGSPVISGDAYFINSFVTPKPSAAIMLSGTFFSRFAARFTSSGTISILYGSSEIRLKHGITQVRPSRTANSTPRRPASKASFTSQSDAPAAQQLHGGGVILHDLPILVHADHAFPQAVQRCTQPVSFKSEVSNGM